MDNSFNMEYVIHIGGKPLFNLNCNKIPSVNVNLQFFVSMHTQIPQETSFLKDI